jgi:tetratricopeptide (TPR) repeat protein
LLNNLGLAYANLHDRQHAVEYYRRAIEVLPTEGQFWANLGVAQLRLRDEEGWQSLDKAVQYGQARATVYLLHGQEFFQAGRYREAAADFQHALEMRPEDPVARKNLDAAQAMMRRNEQN